jgi:phage terminase small subunit
VVKMSKLTPKQQIFVEEYLYDLNATKAAIRAGYSPRTAHVQGPRMLENVRVRAHIEKALAERSRRTGINTDLVLLELARIGRANPADVVNFDEATIRDSNLRDDTAAIQSIKVKKIPTENGEIIEREIKFHDKNRALELLGKHLGMFTDRLNLNAEMAVKIVDDINDGD